MTVINLFESNDPVQNPLLDRITGISNWRVLLQRLDALTAGASNAKPFALTLVGLDRFAFANLIHGPTAVDNMLRELAGTLNASVQQNELVVRVRGDEFALLVVDPPEEQAAQRAEELRVLCVEVLRPYDTARLRTEVAEQSAMNVSIARRNGWVVERPPHPADAPALTATAVLLQCRPNDWSGTSTELLDLAIALLKRGKVAGVNRLWLQAELEQVPLANEK